MSFVRKWGEKVHKEGSPDDCGSPRNAEWEPFSRLWTHTMVWEVEARTAPSLEIARDVTGDVWTSIVLAIA